MNFKQIAFTLTLIIGATQLGYTSTEKANQNPTKSEARQELKKWQKISDDDGIHVWKRDVPGSDFVAFRGKAIIDAPVSKVANVLIDTSRKGEWVSHLAEAKDVRQISEFERIEYNHTNSGFLLVKDRDFVFQAKAELDKDKKQMIIHLKSVEEPSVPEQGPVRGQLNESSYTLSAVDGGKRTMLELEIQADPKGSVPSWIVNLFQKSWPRKTIEGIQKQVAKPDIGEHAGVKRVLGV